MLDNLRQANESEGGPAEVLQWIQQLSSADKHIREDAAANLKEYFTPSDAMFELASSGRLLQLVKRETPYLTIKILIDILKSGHS